MHKYLLIAICGLLFQHNSYSLPESTAISRICIDGSSTDPLGDLLITKLKKCVRDSKDFRIVSQKKGSIILNIICCSASKTPGDVVAYSIAWTIGLSDVPAAQMYLTNQVGVSGRTRVEELPEEILETTRTIIENVTSKKAAEQGAAANP